ncbi:MAG: winged helix-turn-helix transcriptional regulator [Bacteroidales bacterium]|nr:winged helix-turn-helix transcriptional regulator [Bacteroidales bacterium]
MLALLQQDPYLTTRKLAEAIGITPKAIEKQLAKLKAEGLIERDGPDKGGKWKVLSRALLSPKTFQSIS